MAHSVAPLLAGIPLCPMTSCPIPTPPPPPMPPILPAPVALVSLAHPHHLLASGLIFAPPQPLQFCGSFLPAQMAGLLTFLPRSPLWRAPSLVSSHRFCLAHSQTTGGVRRNGGHSWGSLPAGPAH